MPCLEPAGVAQTGFGREPLTVYILYMRSMAGAHTAHVSMGEAFGVVERGSQRWPTGGCMFTLGPVRRIFFTKEVY